jgi:hypothetical protein
MIFPTKCNQNLRFGAPTPCSVAALFRTRSRTRIVPITGTIPTSTHKPVRCRIYPTTFAINIPLIGSHVVKIDYRVRLQNKCGATLILVQVLSRYRMPNPLWSLEANQLK